MPFKNRKQAADLLSHALIAYKGQNPLVLAIPRGAAPMARIIADALDGEMDVVLVHKIRAPFQEELAIGAVDEMGTVYLNPYASDIPQNHIEQEKQKQLEVLHKRRIQYTQAHKPPSPVDRIVIVVDDGIATGATMIAALKSLRRQHPKKLIVATAVAPLETLKTLQGLADQVICLESSENFYAVGQFFIDFPQISDEEVIQLLRKDNDTPVKIPVDSVILEGILSLPQKAKGIVIFAHGSGSSHLSPRNQYVAQVLQQAHIGTLLFDLLTQEEDENYEMRFHIPLLTRRLIAATQWLQKQQQLPLGYFGASTGAASALMAAAELGDEIRCVVSRGGRPDLAMPQLKNVLSPTLLIVGGLDTEVIELNQQAYAQLQVEKELAIVPGATHLFEEPGTLEQAAHLAKAWFMKYLSKI
jgi:putative phosphoribosyl transferase